MPRSRRYLTEVINNSWGLPVCTIKCPACNDILPKYTWSKVSRAHRAPLSPDASKLNPGPPPQRPPQYVSPQTLARYEQFNRPYRGFVRHCSGCGSEVHVTPAPVPMAEENIRCGVKGLLRARRPPPPTQPPNPPHPSCPFGTDSLSEGGLDGAGT